MAINLECKLNVNLRLVKPDFMQSTAVNLEFKLKVIFKLLSCNRPVEFRLYTVVQWIEIYTETIKLCPLYVYVCQFQMYERISFKFSHYQLWSFRKVFHIREIHLIVSRAADKAANTSTLNIKSHNINSLCDHHNPEF